MKPRLCVQRGIFTALSLTTAPIFLGRDAAKVNDSSLLPYVRIEAATRSYLVKTWRIELHEGKNRNLGNRLVIRRGTHAAARIAVATRHLFSPLPLESHSPAFSYFSSFIRYFFFYLSGLFQYQMRVMRADNDVTRAVRNEQ